MSVIERLTTQAFRAWLYWRSNPLRLRRHLAALDLPEVNNLRRIDPEAVRVAAVQLELKVISQPETYIRHVTAPVVEAVEDGAQLVVLPEDAATHLVGLLPEVAELAEDEARPESLDAALASLTDEEIAVADIFRLLGPAMERIYTATFSALARQLNVYIAAGSAVLPEGDRVLNIGHCFGPDGRLIGRQPKTHLLPLEGEWGLSPGDDVAVYPTAVGTLGLPVCMDASFFEPLRLMTLMGADIVCLPIANPERYHFWRQMRGLWPRLQENWLFGVRSALVGQLFGLRLEGKSGIYGPADLTPEGDGVLAEIGSPRSGGVVTADLNLRRLKERRRRRGLSQMVNPQLVARYLPDLYDRGNHWVQRLRASRDG